MSRNGVIICNDATVVPPLSAELANQTGVLCNGAVVEQAITRRGPHPAHDAPPLAQASSAVQPPANLAGTWLWGGQLYWHFGHFLTESASRLWAFDAARLDIEGIIFLPKRFGTGLELLDWQQEYLSLAGITTDVHVASTPTVVERLLVPEQGFGTGELATGTETYRRFITKRFAANIAPDGPERLYLSRSRFGPRKGGILGETTLEAHLSAEGYEVFHPQEHSLTEQIARMKAAKRIVGPDGSAFHLAGLVARQDVRAAMIMRRNAMTAVHLLRQFEGLRDARLHAINAIRNDWTPNGAPPDRLSFAELDFVALARSLRCAGLIDGEGWSDPPQGTIRKRIRQLSRRRGVGLAPVPPAPRVNIV